MSNTIKPTRSTDLNDICGDHAKEQLTGKTGDSAKQPTILSGAQSERATAAALAKAQISQPAGVVMFGAGPHTPAPSLHEVREGTAQLKPGQQGPAVSYIQQMLHLPQTGVYDATTQAAVRSFQAERGLPSTGDVGPRTLHTLEHPHNPPAPSLGNIRDGEARLKPGEQGPAVMHVQKMLNLPQTGVYDSLTHAAVTAFQLMHGLPATGEVGPRTLGAMEHAHHPPAPTLESIREGFVKLQPGQQGPAVSHLQRLLNMPQTGIYDGATQAAVKHFQEDHGLHSTTHEVGQQTLFAMEHPQHPPAPSIDNIHDGEARLLPGQQGPAVAYVQHMLGLPQTGVYDASTQTAVKEFKAVHGLNSASAEVGPKTMHAMEHAHRDAVRSAINLFHELSSPNSLLSIAIGRAENTRTRDGGFTANYAGHRDPGNHLHNVGTFSFQGHAHSPGDADRQQLANMRAQIPAYEAAAQKAGLDPKNPLLAATFFDLYNQAPKAAGDFLTKGMQEIARHGMSAESIAHARTDCFVDPKTGHLDTTFASRADLMHDQMRRTRELMSVVGSGTAISAALSGPHGGGLADAIKPFRQHEGRTCGYACVAMVASAATGKSITDVNLVSHYGHGGGLCNMLNEQCKHAPDARFRNWHDFGNLNSEKQWNVIEHKVNHDKVPVLVGLGGQFSASGYGHVVAITKIRGNDVTYADPATGGIGHTTKEAIMNCAPHHDGKFIISTQS